MENKDVVRERVRRYRERQKGGQPPRMGDVVPGRIEFWGKTVLPTASQEMDARIGMIEKRVAALEADLVDRMVRLEDNVRDMRERKEPTRAVGSYHNRKDSPEELFRRVVAEKAERLSIS